MPLLFGGTVTLHREEPALAHHRHAGKFDDLGGAGFPVLTPSGCFVFTGHGCLSPPLQSEYRVSLTTSLVHRNPPATLRNSNTPARDKVSVWSLKGVARLAPCRRERLCMSSGTRWRAWLQFCRVAGPTARSALSARRRPGTPSLALTWQEGNLDSAGHKR